MSEALLTLVLAFAVWSAPVRAQPGGAPAELLQQEEEAAQAHRASFTEWCRDELASQADQRSELQRLRSLAAPQEGDAVLIDKLSRQAGELSGQLERTRAEAAQLAERKSRAAAALGALEKQVAALSGAQAELQSPQQPGAALLQGGQSASVGAVAELLRRAQAEQGRAVAESQLEPARLQSQAEQLEAEYRGKAADLARLRARRRAAEAGQGLVLTALEDQDTFLEDLRGLCSLGQGVYGRLDEQVRPLLQNSVQLLEQAAEKQREQQTTTQPPSEAAAAAEEDLGPLRPSFERGDSEERRRWRRRFGVLPQEMLSAADRLAKEAQPKERKEKRESIYYSQKGEKRFKAGKGGHEGFVQRERRAANGRSAGDAF